MAISEQWWINEKIWFIRTKRTRLKEGKRRRYYRSFLKDCIERVFNFIRFIKEKHIRLNPPLKKICRQRGVDCCRQDFWVQIELFSLKILENLAHYCGLKVETEWRIEKVARKNLNKFIVFKINSSIYK